MSDPGAMDILDTGERRPWPTPPRWLNPRRWSRRVQVVLLVALLVVATTGFVLDREVRADERVALGRCAAATTAAVERASGLIGYMVGYVRPTIAGLPRGEVREGIYELVSQAAVAALPAIERAERTCGGVDVLAFHTGNRSRHEACRDLLSITRNHLERVRDDGRSAFVDGATRQGLMATCAS